VDQSKPTKARARGGKPFAMGDARGLFGLMARFGIVGLINTAVGIGVIAGLDLGLHVEPHVANLIGYVFGVAVSFTLSRQFVFHSDGHIGATAIRYSIVVGLAFLLNQAVLTAVTALAGPSVNHMVGQLAGMATYTVVVFLACKLWVFRSTAAA
jgi:putative flippase GtrA